MSFDGSRGGGSGVVGFDGGSGRRRIQLGYDSWLVIGVDDCLLNAALLNHYTLRWLGIHTLHGRKSRGSRICGERGGIAIRRIAIGIGAGQAGMFGCRGWVDDGGPAISNV